MLFELNSKLIGHYALGHITLVFAVCWTPWLLFFIEKIATQNPKSKLIKIAPGLILGLIILADIRWSVYSGLLIGSYYFLQRFKALSKIENAYNIKSLGIEFLKNIRYLSLILLSSLLLASPLLIPFMEYMKLSTRSQLSSIDNLSFSFPPIQLINLIIPNFGGYAEWIIYPGIFSIIAIIILLTKKEARQMTAYWIILIFACLILSMGEYLPGVKQLFLMPGMDLLRVPSRFLLLNAISIPVLSAYAVDGVENLQLLNKEKSRTVFIIIAITFFIIIFSLGYAWLSQTISKNIVWSITTVIFIGGIWILYINGWIKQKMFIFVAILFLTIDLAGVNYFGIRYENSFEENNKYSEIIRIVEQNKNLFRVYSPSYSLPQHIGAYYAMELADGIDPLQLISYNNYMEKASGVPNDGYSVTIPAFNNGEPEVDNSQYTPNAELLGKLNVKYILSEFDLEIVGFKYIESYQGTRIYENLFYLPRAWIQETKQAAGMKKTSVPVINETCNGYYVEIEGEGHLVLSDIYFPGWNAYIGKEKLATEKMDIFLAIDLPDNTKRVEFVYQPKSLEIGMVLFGFYILCTVVYSKFQL
ncbi:MAG: YfhO family protein [Bacteroidales bacterium]|nr:YfhO family protein [Bacteroidales bacterium]